MLLKFFKPPLFICFESYSYVCHWVLGYMYVREDMC